MRGNIIILLFAFAALGCSSPKYAFLPKPSEFQMHVKGLYFDAKLNNDSNVIGEIIAVEGESMLLLGVDSFPVIFRVERDSVVKGHVLVCHTSEDAEKVRKRATLIPFLTLGHGGWAIITLPVNIMAVSSIANSATNGPYQIAYPADITWEQLEKFARFPAGLPETVPVDEIQ